jgi:hypothetical protein
MVEAARIVVAGTLSLHLKEALLFGSWRSFPKVDPSQVQ